MHVQPGVEGAGGFVKAIDVTTGRTKWTHPMPDANWGGLMSTATGLVFGGGRTPANCLLWTRIRARCSGSTARARAWLPPRSPMRSTANSMFATSLAWRRDSIWSGEMKDKYYQNTPQGGMVMVFALK